MRVFPIGALAMMSPCIGATTMLQEVRTSSVKSCSELLANAGQSKTSAKREKEGNDDLTGTTCEDPWSVLRPLIKPTQADVGYAWIARKLSKDFYSASKAQEVLDGDPAPVVLGPNGTHFYIIDDHHTLAALDYSKDSIGCADCVVTVQIVCDWRTMPAGDVFWDAMQESSYVYTMARAGGGGGENTVSRPPSPSSSSTTVTAWQALFSAPGQQRRSP